MNSDTLLLIKTECEKIEKSPGFGQVKITIENGAITFIHPTSVLKIPKRGNSKILLDGKEYSLNAKRVEF